MAEHTLAPARAPVETLTNVQALRGVAALLVVFVHLQGLARLAGAPADLFAWGNAGVDIFFVISGLIMVRSTARRRVTPLDFMQRRIARVVPLYWLVTLAVFALVLIRPGLFESTTANPAHLFKSLAFTPYARADGTLHPIVFLGWTLNYEMAFYLLFALGLALSGGRWRWAAPALLIVAAVTAGLVFRPASPVLRFYTAPILLEFVAGMALGALLPPGPLTRPKARLAVACGLLAFVLLLVSSRLWPLVDRAVVAGAPAAVLVASSVLAERGGMTSRWRWAERMGDASYSIYLTHFFVTGAMTKMAARVGIHDGWTAVAFILITLLTAIGLGWAVYRWVESPVTRFVQARTRRAAETRPPHAAAQLAEL